jgi:hypothetical protein
MTFSILVCLAAFFGLLWMLRADRVSLGLPIAYLCSLLLIHVPGAFAHAVNDGFLYGSDLVEIGIDFTAIGSICFVAGVWLARFRKPQVSMPPGGDHYAFWFFCLIGGWIFTFGLGFLRDIPSVGAAVINGGAVWMLGVMLGLRAATERGDIKWIGFWLCVLMAYPVVRLLTGGFLSYGIAAAIVVCSILAISIRSRWRVVVGLVVVTFLGLTIFVNYFSSRNAIRNVVWGGADVEERVDAVLDAGTNFEWFDSTNKVHLLSLNIRLNQNYFVGIAATRIERKDVDYLYGRSLWEAALSLVPRALWPEKPVYGGSPEIVRQMTGLPLSTTTSWGVGNVMEFHINFGIPGLIAGFFALGWLLGSLDRKAAAAESRGDLGKTILFFLPAVALIQPNGSMVEMFGGAAAAVVAAFGWKWAWDWCGGRVHAPKMPGKIARKPL